VDEEHEIGAERAIDQQFAAPMTVRPLLAQKILLRSRDRVGNPGISRQIRLSSLGRCAWQCDDVSWRTHWDVDSYNTNLTTVDSTTLAQP
jgi:hypothetical protein